jgi:hypothetical protein
MIEFLSATWFIEAVLTIVAASIVAIAVCYWVDRFRGE